MVPARPQRGEEEEAMFVGTQLRLETREAQRGPRRRSRCGRANAMGLHSPCITARFRPHLPHHINRGEVRGQVAGVPTNIPFPTEDTPNSENAVHGPRKHLKVLTALRQCTSVRGHADLGLPSYT